MKYAVITNRSRTHGFALVVTLSLMILLTVIAVGLLTLANISLRTSSQGEAMATARANARMSLILAIGELQRQAGPDTRVTARADILDDPATDSTSPPVLGVWRSWEGSDHEMRGPFAGRPISPGSDYRYAKQSRFLAWLTSANNEDSLLASIPPNATNKKITLLGKGSVGGGIDPVTGVNRDKLQIHLPPTLVSSGKQPGGMAWWIGGENQKAYLPKPHKPKTTDSTLLRKEWTIMAKSHSVADTKPFGLDQLLMDAAPAEKTITMGQTDLLPYDAVPASPRSQQHFHDLTAQSVGLLTNTATGGWRKDLSLLTESWNSQPKNNLPFFQITPTTASQASIPIATSIPGCYPPSAMLYPWAAYRPVIAGQNLACYSQGAVASWENLKDYALHYQRVSVFSNGRVTAPIYAVNGSAKPIGDHYNFTHRVRVMPLIARVQWVFSHSSEPNLADPTKYEARLLLTPAITMWNPYNVEITTLEPLNFLVDKGSLPTALRYSIDGTQNSKYNAVMTGGDNNAPDLSYNSAGFSTLNFSITDLFTLIPGETRLFSPTSKTPVPHDQTVPMSAGYRSGGGNYFTLRGPDDQKLLSMPGSTRIKADAKFDTTFSDNFVGVGINLDLKTTNWGRPLAYRMVYKPEIANIIYPPILNMAESTLSQCATNPQPFLSTIFGARTASNTHLAAKGFVQSSPLVNYTVMGGKELYEIGMGRHYGGTGHPVNSPFDLSFVKHAAGGDSLLPNVNDTTNRGYIVTGFSAADGLSRCVIAELPIRPLVSLAELTHWDLRYENPTPPYAINIIANSDATPLLPSDKVVNDADAKLSVNLQYDDFYCANHLLFDDWFISSITPEPTTFGPIGRTQKETYADFLTGVTPLANRAYRPILEDRTAANVNDALYVKNVKPTNAWQTIASRLEVDGMFNVNSTSVTAWRALLGHARNQRVPYILESEGEAWKVELSEATNHVLSRFSIAADTKTGTPGFSGKFPNATEFTGYRTVDGVFLDALAKEVVKQIRARGPFLSLSEFVNRQLSSGNLALAGTLQAALNKLAEKPATDPFGELKANSTVAVSDPPLDNEEYKFREAAAGYSAYGMPGWTRQADILRPLAPILSVRDDTFTIRSYGDARDASGKVIANAMCEAVVRRTRNYVDPADKAETSTLTSAVNKIFGRRFEIVSFRWLASGEI